MTFKELHRRGKPLLLANVWDVPSALAAEATGYRAVGTSSAAIAQMLGYADGEEISFSTLLFLVERIRNATALPLSVDLEHGYGSTAEEITHNVRRLIDLGVIGVNLEDSVMTGSKRQLVEATPFADTIGRVIARVRATATDFFFNLRTDPFLLDHDTPTAEAIHRAALYAGAGADGLFVPGIYRSEDIVTVLAATDLPLNVMCWPELPGHAELATLGVARISSGNFLYGKTVATQQTLFDQINRAKNFAPLM